MKRTLLLILLYVFTAYYSFSKEYKVASPDNKISVKVNVGTDIKWSASCNGKEIINNSKIAMIIADGRILGGK